MRLVIVESPAKAKTINKYLGSGYKVMASYGHIRDLLAKDGSVRPDDNFSMTWEMSERGEKQVKEIIRNLKGCDELLLATDPDREGEAISWHIREVLDARKRLNVPFRRIAFHEITKSAIQSAIANPRDIDLSLVDAYLARRALDYLVGFTLSPILWRKLPGSRSAGRVQSVALRIIVDREAEIEAFKKQEYWSIEGEFLSPSQKSFPARLTHHKGKKLDKFDIKNEKEALEIKNGLSSEFSVSNVESKIVKRNPAPAFITSTLQQEASRKLGFSAKKTMQLAQQLYEGVTVGGETLALITYMRTDSTNLSADAVKRIRGVVSEKYGEKFLPSKPRVYSTKVKNAQEAHEAIRPVDAGILPESLQGKLAADLLKLYTLIWRRAVASQMASAEFNQVQVDLSDSSKNIFRANGNTVVFDGFLKVYTEGKDEGDDNQDNPDEEGYLPPLNKGDETPTKKIDALQHFTTPPPRFSEASLVKKMEELGIGRPSTYATILQVLQDRGYVKLVKKFFVPEIRGRLVTSFLMNFFAKYLEYGFTADMEQSLDDISNSVKSKLDVLNVFWNGFHDSVEQIKDVKMSEVIDRLNETMEQFLFSSENGLSRTCPECHKGELSLKISRYGSFIGCSCYPECKYVKKLDSSPVTDEDKAMRDSSEFPKFLGNDPKDNGDIFLKKGPYGLYIEKALKKSEQAASSEGTADKSEETEVKKSAAKKKSKSAATKEKPIRSSVPSFLLPDQIDLKTALFLLSLPKSIGQLDGEEIKIGIGRFGPYVLYKGKYTSIPKNENILTYTQEQAISLINKKAG